jgi:trimeric autotransporter adhesin
LKRASLRKAGACEGAEGVHRRGPRAAGGRLAARAERALPAVALARSAIMSPGLQRRHPGIRTYSGRGIDDSAATIHADLSRFGFHASVRSPNGGWYIDPFFRKSPNL